MADAIYQDVSNERRIVAATKISAGEIYQMADGRAGVFQGAKSCDEGFSAAFVTDGVYQVPKTTGVVMLDGCEVWWDHSADKAIPRPASGGSDKDFFLGTLIGDAASADTTCVVNLNVCPHYIFDVRKDPYASAPVNTAGDARIVGGGGTLAMMFTATAEAQKVDILSRRSWPVTAPWIFEAIVCVRVNADADVADLSVGVANGTHASDADSITESAFFHFDMGADLNIDAESDDDTTEVGATDTTADFAVGTPVHLMLDGRDMDDVRYYVNGVEVLGATANLGKLTAATGPLRALIHLEKSSNDSPGVVDVDMMTVRIAEQ